MTERIEISYDERLAADRAVLEILREENSGKDASVFARILVGAALKAIDGVRTPDTVGTIRRGSNGNVAVRVRVFNEYELPVERWVHISTSSGVMARSDNDYVCDWPVIFTPDGAA